MIQTPKTQTPGRAAFARLFPAMTMTAAKAEARALGVTVRPDPLGPCQDGGRLIEVFPRGCGSSAVSAFDPAEAVFWARCFHEDSKANRIGWAGTSKDSQVRVMVMAALNARGFGPSGVSLSVTLTAGPTASADCVATVDGPAGSISARFHEFTGRGALAMAAEFMAESLSRQFPRDCNGLSLSAFDPEAAPIDPAEGMGFGVETVTESAPLMIRAGVMEPEPTPEAFPTVRHAAEARARFVDVTPTWAGLVPAFRAILENGTPEGVAMVWAELARMAHAADSGVAAEERAQIEAARAAEAEAVAALSDIMTPRPCHYSQEAEATLDAGAVNRAERARVAAEPLAREGQAPEAQTTAQRAQNAAGAVIQLAAARRAARRAVRAAQPPASGFSLAHEFGPHYWQGKAAGLFREAARLAELAGLSGPAAILTHAAQIAADKAEGFDGMAQTRAV